MTSEKAAGLHGLTVRQIVAEEWPAWYRALGIAFGEEEDPSETALWRDLTELDRSLGVWDGDSPRTTAAADLALDVRELGSAYLGGTTLTALARAGLVQELRAGALAEASPAFASDVAPWLPHGF